MISSLRDRAASSAAAERALAASRLRRLPPQKVDLPACVEAGIEQVKVRAKLGMLRTGSRIGAEFVPRRRSAGVELREQATDGSVAIGPRLPNLASATTRSRL